jgi:ribosome assembly protein RRB1
MQTHSHASEGFALGWSPQSVGSFACGDCSGALHVWSPKEGGSWTVSGPYAGHSGSVEDIQWSPTEATVFATACVDKVRHTASVVVWHNKHHCLAQYPHCLVFR